MINGDTRFFIGVVVSTDAITYNVQVETFGGTHASPMQGIPLAGVFASTFGFKESIQYAPGSIVLCYYVKATTCYILGVVPQEDYASLGFPARVALQTADGNFDAQNTVGYNADLTKMSSFNQGRPTDVVEGEHVVSNEFGVLLGLFQQLAVLKGSELAHVQCYLLYDLGRIISHNYEHLHAMGEVRIFHDGRALMAEYGITHDPRESLGVAQVNYERNQPVFEESEAPGKGGKDETDFYKFTENDRIKAIERLKIFLGKCGDLVHMFITKPDPDAIRSLNGNLGGGFDKGMADFHVGLDGRISVRTVTGAAIEKTNWVQVPHRVRTAEDPEGDNNIEFEKKDPFEFDNSQLTRGNPSLYFLQIRDCNAYLQDFYSYKNFLKYEKDFKLSKNPSNEAGLNEIEKVDPMTEVKLKDYTLRRSGIYLMDNGGIMIKDAWGSALVFEGGDIYIQPAKDLIAQPLRNYIAKAGQFVSVTARKDIDLSSTEEGFRLKTKKVQHLYSDEEGIVLQSDSNNQTAPSPDDKAYEQMGGILFKSKQGVYTYGKQIFDRATEKALYKSKKLMVESVDEKLGLRSNKEIEMLCEKAVNIISLGGDVNAVAKGGSMNVIASGNANFGGTSTNVGNQGSVVGMVPHPGSLPAILDGVLPIADIVDAYAKAYKEVFNKEDYQKQMSPFHEDKAFTDIKFRFLDSSKYALTAKADCIPQTIAQQDDESFGFLNLTTWDEKLINGTAPFPGADRYDDYYVTCEIQNLQDINGDIYSKDSESLSKTGSKLNEESLQKYKVIK